MSSPCIPRQGAHPRQMWPATLRAPRSSSRPTSGPAGAAGSRPRPGPSSRCPDKSYITSYRQPSRGVHHRVTGTAVLGRSEERKGSSSPSSQTHTCCTVLQVHGIVGAPTDIEEGTVDERARISTSCSSDADWAGAYGTDGAEDVRGSSSRDTASGPQTGSHSWPSSG